MKKLLFSALLTVLVTISSFAATSSETNARAVRIFETDFKEATNARWSATNDYLKVSFTLQNKAMEAFYDKEGEFIGVSHQVAVDELPVGAKRSLAKKLAGYTVHEAIKFEAIDETAYFVSAENESRSVFLKVTTYGLVSLFKQVKK